MPGTLTFVASDVAKLVEHAKGCSEFRVSTTDLFDPAMHKGGKVIDEKGSPVGRGGWPDADNIDKSKLRPSLWLVGDQGVYLMSNGIPALPDAGGGANQVVYAQECDPNGPADDWYEEKRRIFGGDDGCDALPIADFERLIGDGYRFIKIRLTARTIRISGSNTGARR